MGRIQSNVGLITGTNITSTVDQLIKISAQPRDRLQSRIAGLQSQQVMLNELTATVIGVQLQSDRIGSESLFSTTTASSSKPDVLSVNATGSPVPGTFSVRTVQTSQTAAATSNAFVQSSDTVQAGDFVVRTGGFIDGSSALEDLRGGLGVSRGKIRITDRSGTAREVDLNGAITIDDVVKQINTTSGLRVTAKTDGDRIVLSDTTALNASNLIVEEVGAGRTAADLGLGGINVEVATATGEDLVFLSSSTRLNTLRDGRGIAFGVGSDLSLTLKNGSTVSVDFNTSREPNTLGQMVSAINAVDSSRLEARISSDGNGIEFIDKTTGSGTLAASGRVSDQLGITGVDGGSGTLKSVRIQSSLSGPLLSSLNGGKGLGQPGSISITNRNGGPATQVNLSGTTSLREVIDRINGSSAGVTASLNRARTGILIQDTTGATTSNLIIADGDASNTATGLKIATNAASNSVDSGTLGLQFIAERTTLASLNQGRGIRLGAFTITNSRGVQANVNLSSTNARTVGDAISSINAATGSGVTARLNDDGDGIVLIDNAGGTGTLTVADTGTGNAALDLGIRKSASTVITSGGAQQQINGSQNFKLTLTGSETLTQFVEKVNGANGPLTASLLTTGSSTVRVLFSSRSSGEIGRFQADGDAVGVSVTSTASARDAVITVGGSSEGAGNLLKSSTDTFANAFNGLTLRATGVSPDPVQITVSTDSNSLERNVQLFVDQINKVYDKIRKESSFNPETGATGALFGSGEVLRVQQGLSNLLTSRTFGLGGTQTLEQLGVGPDQEGKLQFDKSKFNDRLARDPDGVKAFLSDKTKGFGVRAKATLERLVGIRSGTLVVRTQTIQVQIDASQRRVETMNLRLDNERNRLLRQFYGMEEAIGKILNNQSAINGIKSIEAPASR
jgi:flagellar hook-associated protein 2